MKIGGILFLFFCGVTVGVAAAGEVSVRLFEKLPNGEKWAPPENAAPLPEAAHWTQTAFGFSRLPLKYNDQGVRDDLELPALLRAEAEISLPKGPQRVLVRSRGGSRLLIDGQNVAETPFLRGNSDGHEPVEPLPDPPAPGGRIRAYGDSELLIDWVSDGRPHRWTFEEIVGGKKFRPDVGESTVAVKIGAQFRLLGGDGAGAVELTDDGWRTWTAEQTAFFDRFDIATRREAGKAWAQLFHDRHAATPGEPVESGSIDAFLAEKMAHQRPISPAVLILSEQCQRCHGEKAKGGLRLDSREALLGGGDSEKPAIVPGDPGKSELIRRLRATDDDKMPPKGEHLGDAQIAALEQWIRDGASWEGTEKTKPIQPAPLTDDHAFLRRLWLDTVGVVPDASTVRAFVADPAPDKRARTIDRLLDDPRWADHWTGYWQDVLAENPGMLKPSQNNTGPFRFWIHESFFDNKPMDRFVTELILMRGSLYFGGPRGFGMAADNDAPMAEKAHVLGSAFLGLQMKCARCHDAPFHSTLQRDLFSLAALLEGKAVTIPKTSRVPAAFFEAKGRQSLIKVTQNPDQPIPPQWPFEKDGAPATGDAQATRRLLAEKLVADERFAPVLVNRMWQRYFGVGLVEPVDDWEGNRPSHPELLRWLSRRFVQEGYDWKKLARLILKSEAYQRRADGGNDPKHPELRFFAAPEPRRMTGEQIVDSLFAAAGSEMDVEELSFDSDSRRPAEQMTSLGVPRRAWMFCSLANERDRPALALPKAQAVFDVLCAFGWRSARAEPLTVRDQTPNALQAGTLANGTMASWVTRASQTSGITRLALKAATAESLTDDLFLQMLGRLPKPAEKANFLSAVSPGFSSRVLPEDQRTHVSAPQPLRRVSWSNHLHPEATVIKLEEEKLARAGAAPSPALRTEWRERYEDAVWALINSPEFIMTP